MKPFNIFISYSRDDKAWVYELEKLLRTNDLYEVWIDRAKLVGGDNWWNEIRTNIEKCDCFLFVVTPKSLESDYCSRELEYAIELEKVILPIIHKNCSIPETLQPIQCLDVTQFNLAETLLQTERSLHKIHVTIVEQQAENPPQDFALYTSPSHDNLKPIYEKGLIDGHDYTTTSTSFVDIDTNGFSVKSSGSNVLVGFRALIMVSSRAIVFFDVSIDDEPYDNERGIYFVELAPRIAHVISFSEPITGLLPKLKTFRLSWKVQKGTVSLRSDTVKFWVQKFPN